MSRLPLPGRAGPGPPPSGLSVPLTALVVAALGVPVGAAWALVAPRADLVPSAAGLALRDGETKDFIAADGLLFLLGISAGVLVTLLASRFSRADPPGRLVALVVGGGVAAWVATRTGALLAGSSGALGAARITATELPLRVHSRAALLGWPAATAASFLVATLRQRPEPDDQSELADSRPDDPDSPDSPDSPDNEQEPRAW